MSLINFIMAGITIVICAVDFFLGHGVNLILLIFAFPLFFSGIYLSDYAEKSWGLVEFHEMLIRLTCGFHVICVVLNGALNLFLLYALIDGAKVEVVFTPLFSIALSVVSISDVYFLSKLKFETSPRIQEK